MEGLRKTLSASVTHTVSEEAVAPRVRGGESRSDQPGQKPQRYSTHTSTPMTQLLILRDHTDDLWTNTMKPLGTLIQKLIYRSYVVLSAINSVITIYFIVF